MKKKLALVLAFVMVFSFAACGNSETESQTNEPSTGNNESGENGNEGEDVWEGALNASETSYTVWDYSTALSTSWNPHTWQDSGQSAVMGYIESPLVDISILDSEQGIYQWVYEMATSIEDVTATHKDDLTKYGVTLPAGQSAEDTTEGYVFEIKLNPNAVWENGTVINADTYVYSMQQMLNPEMKNYRGNSYYDGDAEMAGARAYYWQGSTSTEGVGIYDVSEMTVGEDGVYLTPSGYPAVIVLTSPTDYFGGNSFKDYVDAYGEAYFGVEDFQALEALADDEGNVALTDETLKLLIGVITASPDWGEDESYAYNYVGYQVAYGKTSFDTVGLYKVDDYTIRYVTQNYIDINYFLTNMTSNWLVYEELYEAGKEYTGELVTTNYATSLETTMSYGPYRMDSLQTEKQMVFVQNENWYGYEKQADGTLISYTNFKVDGQVEQQYMTTRVVINVMDADAAKQAFLKGQLSSWTPTADDLPTYATSEQLYKVDQTYLMTFFFDDNLDDLKEMDNSKGNTNSVVLSNVNFRKALSLSVDREEWVGSTSGYKAAYGLISNLYFYDVYNDPESIYRHTDQAMQAICDLYGVAYGAGTPYATLKDAYESINGYNLTEAKALMAQACQELVADGLYTEGEDIYIRVAYSYGATTSSHQQQMALMNQYINAAAEGSGFGTITLEPIGNLSDPNPYDSVGLGEFAIGYGGWGGAAFYPFEKFRVFCDYDYMGDQLVERRSWSPWVETLTLNINGEDVTMTWQDWSRSMIGTGRYSTADFDTKLEVTSQIEKNLIAKYHTIPLASSTSCFMMSYQLDYFTQNYNIMYDFGGLRLYRFNYNDAEWLDYINSQNGALNYE